MKSSTYLKILTVVMVIFTVLIGATGFDAWMGAIIVTLLSCTSFIVQAIEGKQHG